MENHDFLRNATVYLLTAVIAVPISRKLKLGSVIGYLAGGCLIGPAILGLVNSPEQVLHFSEFGVVLLMFLIGLELHPKRLWQMRTLIFGMGTLQVVLSIAGFALLGLILGESSHFGLVAGMGFAMSSTALALQILRERNLHQIPAGQASFAVLLFQDLSVIPMLALLPLLAVAPAVSSHDGSIPAVKGAIAIVGVVVVGRWLVRPLFRIVASTNLQEVFTAFALFIVIGIAHLMNQVGLSMALGAFLAGVVLADSEFRHELEIDIEPFKGLLLGLFFIAVGMSMDFHQFIQAPLRILTWVAGIIIIKMGLLYGLGRVFKYSPRESSILSLALSQGGEFAFVLFGVASQLGVLKPGEADVLNIAVAMSMALTPFLFLVYERLILPRLESRHKTKRDFDVQSEGNKVILAGFGRIGQVVGRLLHAQKIGVTILELDPGQIDVVRRFGWKTFYGDVSRLELLRAAGAADAKLLILAIDDMDAAERTIKMVQEHFPNLKLLVRAEDRLNGYHFTNMGIPTVRATMAPGLEMAEEAMKLLGFGGYESHHIVQKFKKYDQVQFLRVAKHAHDEKTMISMAKEYREELERIMANDNKRRSEIVTEGWG